MDLCLTLLNKVFFETKGHSHFNEIVSNLYFIDVYWNMSLTKPIGKERFWDDKVPFLFKGYKRRPNAWILHPFEQRVFFSVPHHWDTGHAFIMVICEDPWHSHLMSSVWQWSCYYLFYRLRSVRAGIRKPNLPLAGRTLLSTVPPRRLFWSWCL